MLAAMTPPTAIELAARLLRFDTTNPPGGEEDCARYLAGLLEAGGFAVAEHQFAPGRASLVAHLPGKGGPALCITGHLDTVPLGSQPWSMDPLAGEISQGRLWGRGACDMKSGVAALVRASLAAAARPGTRRGLVLALTAGEETGCQGAGHLAELEGALPPCGALLVAEPTANRPALGHRGAIWIEVTTRGKAAHGSTPHLGVNAIRKAAQAVLALDDFSFSTPPHQHMGQATINLGTIQGGVKPNMVPDRASFTLDVRNLPGQNRELILAELAARLGPECGMSILTEADPVWTPPDDPWARQTMDLVAEVTGRPALPWAAPYFTDAAALRAGLGPVPALILGPGDPAQAHQTDEFCPLEQIEQAEVLYARIIAAWMDA